MSHRILRRSKEVDLYTRGRELENPAPLFRQPELTVKSDLSVFVGYDMTRWLAPYLSETKYAIFMDCDMILSGDIHRVLEGGLAVDKAA